MSGNAGAAGHSGSAGLEAKLDEVALQYDELNAELQRPETLDELAGAGEMRDHESDEEMRRMAHEEVNRLEAVEADLLEELKVLLLPRDPADDGNVILEIRAGAGGE